MSARLLVVVSDSSLAMLAGVIVSRRAGLTLVLVGSCLTLLATRAAVWPALTPDERVTWDASYAVTDDDDVRWQQPIYSPASLTHPVIDPQTTSAQPLVSMPEAAELLGTRAFGPVSR